MVPRLCVPSMALGDRELDLPAEEADHLRLVLRAKPGDRVRVFDGRGSEREGRVAAAGRGAVRIALGAPVTAAPESRVRVTLAQAVLKGDKIDAVVRDAVALGVAAVQPLLTARTDVPPSAFDRGGRVDRWRRIAVASTKQCGRAVLTDVRPPCSLEACLDADGSESRVLLAEPSAAPRAASPASMPDRPGSALILVGPEGGWTLEEVAAALRAGCVPLTLGPRTLRADVAPVVALSVLLGHWGEIPGPGSAP